MRRSISDLALGVALGLAASSPDPVRRIAHNSIHHLPKGKRDLNKCFWLSIQMSKHCIRMQAVSW